jgi:GT2 family glycosyltransferase
MIEIISATRLSNVDFWSKSALGISLRRLRHDGRLVARLTFMNRCGLPQIYNDGIMAKSDNDMLVFVHDDVWIEDSFLADRVIEGLRMYDVIGVAGNRRRARGQASWVYMDVDLTVDDKSNLSGSVAHGEAPFSPVWHFGPVPASCELLDGVFLAARRSVLTGSGVLFDPQFDFHFYDMDFCRSVRKQGLRLGTWPISLTHRSTGAFHSQQWRDMYRAYIEKWGD